MSRSGIVRLAREVFLTVGALLGLVCLVATVASVAFGIKPLVFRSGSMSPAIATGDLAISRTVDASTLRSGDIVSVINASGTRVTHRIVSIAEQGQARQLTLKGDDNQRADLETYTVTRVEKVMFDIPKAGHVVEAARSPVGLVLLGGYLLAMLALVVRRRPSDGDDDEAAPAGPRGGARKAEKPRRGRSGVRMTAVALTAATAMVAAPAVAAPWTDDVPVTGTALAAATLAPPGAIGCVAQGGLLSGYVDVGWTPASAIYKHRVTLSVGANKVALTPDVAAGTSTKRILASDAATLLALGSTVTVTVNATAGTNWISTAASTRTVKATSLLGLGLDIRCA